MDQLEARERVARGAARLDQRLPGWFHEIDFDRLFMSACNRCILGQLYGVYTAGRKALDIAPGDESYGFVLNGQPRSERDYAELREAWKAAIAERLTPAVAWTHRTEAGPVSA